MSRRDQAFEDLWNDPAPRGAPFSPDEVAALPEGARRYLTHAVAPGTPRASAVRLSMRGSIKLGGWCPFEAEQVIRWQRGFVWRATARVHGLPVSGSDRWVDGEGAMRWKLLGLVPVVTAEGPDISRASLGRVQVEAVWLPSALLGPDVAWQARDPTHLGVDLALRDEHGHLEMTVDARGALRTVSIRRWGNPEGEAFHAVPFGAIAEDERCFEGYTIPTKLRVGWYFGTDRFEPEGEFFRCTIEHATFR
ncbi:MAG: hypothetical protein JWM10_4784 [Myxococcaceae bacterium]|nr:hypothetical protein [Myxococcaceae bacterium]